MWSNVWKIVFAAMTLVVLLANALEDNERRLDSSSLIIAHSNSRAELFNELAALSRKTRAIDSKLARGAQSESSSRRDSLLIREPRSAEDNENNDTRLATTSTTSLPLGQEDSSTPNSEASSVSPAVQNTATKEETDSSLIKSDDPESSDEKDKAASDNDAAISAISTTLASPTESASEEAYNEHELLLADQHPHEASTPEATSAIKASSEDIREAEQADQAPQKVSTSEAVPATKVSSEDVHEAEQANQMPQEISTSEAVPATKASAEDLHELEQADQAPQETSTSDDIAITKASPEEDKIEQTSNSKDLSSSEASEHQTQSSEDVQGKSVVDLEALEHMHPDLELPLETQSTPSSEDHDGSSEQADSEAPVSASSPAGEVHEEETSVVTSSPAIKEEQTPVSEDNAQEQSSASDSDVTTDMETTTLIIVVDPISVDAVPPEKSSSEAATTENSENKETTEEPGLNVVPITKNEDIDEITDEDNESGVTEATFDEATSSPAVDKSSEEAVTDSSLAYSSSSTPAPISKYNFMVYDNDSNVPCILAAMSITLRVTYATKDRKAQTKSIPIPSTASVSGSCGEKNSNMTLTWVAVGASEENSITFLMKKDDAQFFISNVQVSLVADKENFPNVIDQALRGNSAIDLRLFPASLKSGEHVCQAATEVTCGPIVVAIKDVSLVAYNDRDSLVNREEEHCTPAPKSASIAAIVGGVVGVTVIIGIVASYAWYRKRTGTFRSELP